MPNLPRAILLDLDDTILSAFGRGPSQWRRVVAAFAEHLEPHPPDQVVEAMLAYSRYLWADEMRHKHWRHRIGEARRHIVANAFAELCTKHGRAAPPPKARPPDLRPRQALNPKIPLLHQSATAA